MIFRERPHYTRAPLTHAILQVAFEPPAEPIAFDALAPRLRDALAPVNGATEYTLRRADEANQNSEVVAVAIDSADGKIITLASAETCIAMRREPYETWEQFYPTFQALWRAFVSAVRVEKIIDVNVHYANQMDIGVGDAPDTLEGLLNIYPVILPAVSGMTTDRSSLSQRLLDENVDFEIALSNTAGAGRARRIILDLRARATEHLRNTIEDYDLAAAFDCLHARIDEVFNAAITDQTREFLV
jgi:uncharacterized protein (TIGR04255 family)